MFRVRIVGFGARGCGFKLAFWAVCRIVCRLFTQAPTRLNLKASKSMRLNALQAPKLGFGVPYFNTFFLKEPL